MAEVLAAGAVVFEDVSDVAGAMGKSGVEETAVVGTSAPPIPLVVLVQPATSAAAATSPIPARHARSTVTADSVSG